jgi:hypothetical protein
MRTQNLIKAATLLGLLAFLSACGSQTLNKSDQSSEVRGEDTGTTIDYTGKSIAECSGDLIRNNGLDVSLRALPLMNSNPVRFSMQHVRVRLNSVPSQFMSQDSGYRMRIFAWTQSSNAGVPQLSSALAFQVRNRKTGYQVIGNNANNQFGVISALNFTKVNEIIAYNNWEVGSNQAAHLSAGTFFAETDLLVNLVDTTGLWKVLKVVIYDADGAVVQEEDMLIPTYYADYNVYKVNRAPALKPLHPNQARQNEVWSQEEWKSWIHTRYCFQ